MGRIRTIFCAVKKALSPVRVYDAQLWYRPARGAPAVGPTAAFPLPGPSSKAMRHC